MASIVYLLCGLTSGACAFLLYRQYRRMPRPLLLSSVICFACLAVTNTLLYVDLILFPDFDLSVLRSALTLLGLMVLLHGLIKEST